MYLFAKSVRFKKQEIKTNKPHFDIDTLIHYAITNQQDDKDETSKFEISVSDDFSGRWAFKSIARGYFLGASAEAMVCTAKHPGDAELFFVHLAARPQVNLLSIGKCGEL